MGQLNTATGVYEIEGRICSGCNMPTLELTIHGSKLGYSVLRERRMIYPHGTGRAPCPSEVPEEYKRIYEQACAVLPESAEASAALARRCLQHLLRKHLEIKTKSGRLADEIREAIAAHKIPSQVIEIIDMGRVLGNLGAHPEQDQRSGEIIDVQPGEAESVLDLLEELFESYFVRPATMKRKKESLNARLAEARTPPKP